VSDHGESLGEAGLYLHGMPYAIAPDTQKHVPFVLWLSPAFSKGAGLDVQCLRSRAGQAVSHDNLFHTMIGAMDVKTSAYIPGLADFEYGYAGAIWRFLNEGNRAAFAARFSWCVV